MSLMIQMLKLRYKGGKNFKFFLTLLFNLISQKKGPIMRKGETVIQQEHKDKIHSTIQTLEELLEGQEWFSANENPSLADLSILAGFSSIYHAGFDVGNYPNVAAWYERCSALPGFAENESGAKMFGNFLKSKLTEPF
jgi:glutathione S-transferase